MTKVKFTVLALVALFALASHAQTVKWLVEPKYASITHYSDNIFKCTDQNGNLYLIDWDGKSIDIPANADAVTDYSDGYAIVLQGNRILGFLSETSHRFQPVSGDYYATKYSFFSEGYIAVAQGSANGKQGYLDTRGYPVLECNYLEAMPARKGWALVTEDGKDKVKPQRYKRTNDWSGKGMPSLKTGETFVWATSFNTEGYALTKIRGGKYVVIDSDFKEIDRNGNWSKADVNTYDYSYKPAGSREVNPPTNAQPKKNNDYSVSDIVPAQFSEAGSFYGNRAIVAKGGKYGILKLLDGKFEPSWPDNHVRVYPDGMDEIQFQLAVPASLEEDKIIMEFDEGEGDYVEHKGFSHKFKLAKQMTKQRVDECTLRAKATYKGDEDDLLLWEGSKEIVIDYIDIDLSSPVTTSEYADENGNQTISAVITNKSKVAVNVSGTLTVAGKKGTFNGELNPNRSQTIKVTVHVDEDNQQVRATVSAKVGKHNCGQRESQVTLKKI